MEYQGFIRVHMCVQRPIHVSTAITRTSWYRLMRPVKERSNEEAGIEVKINPFVGMEAGIELTPSS